jgi:uncharacterized protein YdaU (DUF1376 family)
MADIEPPPYFWFWVSDFMGGVLAGTDPLDNDEIAIYVLVLCLQWTAQGPLDDDAKRLAASCRRDPRTMRRVLDKLVSKRKLVREGGKIYNKRMQKEIMRHLRRAQAHAEQRALKAGGVQQRLNLIGAIPGGRPRGPAPAGAHLEAMLTKLGKSVRGQG